MNFIDWVEHNLLDVEIEGKIATIKDVGKFLILDEKQFIFNEDYCLMLTEEEYDLASGVDYVTFKLGTKWYYTSQLEKPELVEFKYLGKIKSTLPQVDFPLVGIHGGYDLCNGSRPYNDWCVKAKFLGVSTIGISEENTLAGVIAFQKACKQHDLHSVVGETVRVEGSKGNRYYVKLYCVDRESWSNLLQINTWVSVTTKGYIKEEELFKLSKGLICVISPETPNYVYPQYQQAFEKLYYGFDLTEWESQDKDEVWLANLQDYITNYTNVIKPVLVNDSYYLDKSDSRIRKILGQVGQSNFRNNSANQYLKSVDDYFLEALELFEDDNYCYEFLTNAIENTITAFEGIEFKVVTGEFYLPKYQMTEQEASKFSSNEELLWSYIEKGLDEKVIEKGLDVDTYIKRVDVEIDVIRRGGFIDYFLILADIYRYCNENDIWYGIGRGSAAGCLVSYLCDIVSVDPIEYNLLFERFLNEGRLGKSLPDVDCDFAGERREEIKKYIQQKYGYDYVMSIGTYGTFKLKNAVKDIARTKGIDHTSVNYVTAKFPEPAQQQPQLLHELFQTAVKTKLVYEFLQQSPELIETLPLCLNQPKNASIHAAGMVIVPKEFGTLYQQLPVKEQDGMLVSEWEGHYIEEGGFLKFDVLGIKQLDKFAAISKLIKQQLGKTVTFKDIELDEQGVLELFRLGYTEDVFQFGAAGLKAYCKELQPDCVEDLIATVALYRPGPIESGTHKKYIKIKNGNELSEPDPGCDNITKNTYGLIVYQEQVMQICQHVANFSLVEADDIRKALGKMKPEIVKGYRDTFLERAVGNGYDKKKMEVLWAKMEAFAAYAFNRSHAACYGITGYYSQWFKVHYPLQFWTVSLQYSDDTEMAGRISEIQNTSSITVSPVDINKSDLTFRGDVETNSIYWALPSVKWVGDKVVQSILEERANNGDFFSLEEFYTRTKGYSGMNKRAISHLIISGAFDRVEGIKSVVERYNLLETFYNFTLTELKEDYVLMKHWSPYQWTLKQKELTGFGIFDFKSIIHQTDLVSKIHKWEENSSFLSQELFEEKEVLCAGLLANLVERSYKGDRKLAQLEIRDNTDSIFVTLWDEIYIPIRKELKEAQGKVVVLSGKLAYDSYKSANTISSTKTTKIAIV